MILEQLALSLLFKSLAISAIIIVVFALNALFGKAIPAKLRYSAWLIVLAGLLIPLPSLRSGGIIILPVQRAAIFDMHSETMPVFPEGESVPVLQAYSALPNLSYRHFFYIIWGLAVLVIFTRHIWRYCYFLRTVRRWGKPIEDEHTLSVFRAAQAELGLHCKNIRLAACSFISSSMLTGFVRPMILLPEKQFTRDELELIFRHELIHYRRRDLYIKFWALIAVCVYWFNPLVYRMSEALQAEAEASCDEEALRNSDQENRRFYAEIIIGMIGERNAAPTALSTSFFYRGKAAVKKRLDSVMDAALKPRWPAALALALVMALTALSGSVFAVSLVEAPAFGGRPGITSAAEALRRHDGAHVTLEGRIERFLGGENYLFSDCSAAIVVEIDSRVWGNLYINEHDTVEIRGEIDRDLRSIELDARSVRVISESGESAAQAGYSGPRAAITSAARAFALRDDSPVIMQGFIVRYLGNERYLFSDSTGSIVVDIDRWVRGGLEFNGNERVEISGEIERGLRGVEIEVKTIQKLQEF